MKDRIGMIVLLIAGMAGMAGAVGAQDRTAPQAIAAVEAAQSTPGPMELGAHTISELMDLLGVPGVSIAVIRDFEIHWAKGYGIADVETRAAVDNETLFQAASISKPVAAMAVMRAVQDGMFTGNKFSFRDRSNSSVFYFAKRGDVWQAANGGFPA